MQRIAYILSLLLLFTVVAAGQTTSFKAMVDKNPVGEDERFQLTFRLENAEGEINFAPPTFEGFNVVAGPQQSSGFNNVNGKRVASWLEITYVLQPQTPGKFAISPATIKVGGKPYKSNSLTITVNKSASQGGTKKPLTIEQQIAQNLFLRLELDKSEVYKGEQVTATYKLYRRVQIAQYALDKEPAFTGFWTVDIEQTGNIDYKVDTYNGVQYDVATLKKVALFPQKTGELEVDALGMQCVVLVSTGGWFSQQVPFTFKSNTAKVKVKPLPDANRPADFNGFVGDLNMQVTMDKVSANTDDPITLSIKFSGKGNIKLLENPQPELPKDFDVFDPKISEKSSKQGNVIGGSRQIDYLLIPRRAGSYKVPSFSISYFDLAKKQYVTLSSPEFTIAVEGESTATGNSNNVANISKEEVELLGQDIRYIKKNDPQLTGSEGFKMSVPVFGVVYGAPFLLFFGLLAFKRRRDAMLGNSQLMKHRKAKKVAAKRLKQAAAKIQENDKRGFYDELLKATWGYLGDKLGIPPSELNKEVAATTLAQKGIAATDIKELTDMLDTAEMALYAPSAVPQSMQQTYDRAAGIIDQLENALA